MRDVELTTESPEATRALGAKLGQALLVAPREQPIVIYLNGELGAGKTTFVSGLLRAIGVNGPVRSPTYTLIEPYELQHIAVYHLDLYRLTEARDLEMLALRDLLQPGSVLLVEWAERGGGALPNADLVLGLRYPEASGDQMQQRLMAIKAHTVVGESLLNKLVARAS
jgi:tRNA threonylcarbamoyladenosine biosynthesis protein TsaE